MSAGLLNRLDVGGRMNQCEDVSCGWIRFNQAQAVPEVGRLQVGEHRLEPLGPFGMPSARVMRKERGMVKEPYRLHCLIR